MAKSLRKRLYEAVEARPSDADGWRAVTPADLADDVGAEKHLVSRMLWSLSSKGNVETKKDDSNTVIGVRPLKEPRSYRGDGASTRERKVVPITRTSRAPSRGTFPNTLSYRDNKQQFESLKVQLSRVGGVNTERVEELFQENALAEEALILLERNESLATQISDLRARYESEHRELEYLRKANDKDLRKGLQDAGVLVEHGS